MSRSSVKEHLSEQRIINPLIATKGLTHKQKKFVQEITLGECTGSEAYRRAYKSKGNPRTVSVKASKLKAQDNIQSAINAIEASKEALKYYDSESLRALSVQTMVELLLNPDTSPAIKLQASKTIGTMTEVSLFTHRTESKVIHSSENIKGKILAEIQTLMNAQAEDVTTKDVESLLTELQPQSTGHTQSDYQGDGSAHGDGEPGDPHPHPTPPNQSAESHVLQHTIPLPLSPEDDPLGLKPTHTEKNI